MAAIGYPKLLRHKVVKLEESTLCRLRRLSLKNTYMKKLTIDNRKLNGSSASISGSDLSLTGDNFLKSKAVVNEMLIGC